MQGAGGQAGDGFDHRFRAERGEPVVQAAAGVRGGNRRAHLEQHRAGVEPCFHLHHGDAALRVAGFHRALDRRGAAPARQQRGVAVDAAQARDIEYRLGQDQAIGDHHHQVRAQGRQLRLGLGIAQALRLHDRQAMLQGQVLHRAGHQFLPAAGRPVRLGVDGDDPMWGVEQGLEMLGGEFRGSGEDDAQCLAHAGLAKRKGLPGQAFGGWGHACCRCCFSSFLRMRSRLRVDR